MNNIKTHLFGISFLLLALVLAGVVAYTPTQSAPTKSVEAQTSGTDLYGYAWSPNVGWLSFNCINNNSCAANGGHDYKVTLNSDDTLTGYAWSPFIGWVRFGGLDTSSMPNTSQAPGSSQVNTQKSGTDFLGWARACMVFQSGCSGTTKNISGPELGGWDGWISMKGTANSGGAYGVSLGSDNKFSGYAWDSMFGWFSFAMLPLDGGSDPTLPPGGPSTGGVTLGSLANSPTVDLKVNNSDNPSPINSHQTVNLSWTTTNSPTQCTASGAWSGSKNTAGGSETSAAITTSSVFNVQCTNSSGTGTDSVTVNVNAPSPINVSCSVLPVNAVVGQQVTWQASVTGGTAPYTYSWSGSDGLSGNSASVTKNYAQPGVKNGNVTVTDVDGGTGTCSPFQPQTTVTLNSNTQHF